MSTSSNALVTIDPSTAALAAFGFTDSDPIKPSRLDLLQPIQVADEPGLIAGKFRDTQSNMQYDSINIVPILMDAGRVLFPPGGELGAKPVCRSNNGVIPVINDDLVPQDGGKGCKDCVHSQWKRIGGKSIRPACNETGSFMFAELETGFVYRYNIKGMALAPLRDLKETIRKIVLVARSKGSFAPPYSLTFTLSSVKVKGTKGTYFLPKFTPTGQVNPADLAKFASLYDYFSSRKGQSPAEEADSDPVGAAIEGEYVSTPKNYQQA